MSICTAVEAVNAMSYWVGYYEKATSTYSKYRDTAYFTKDIGSNNYTYAGYTLGYPGQAWCALQITIAMLEACGNSSSDAKTVLHGVYPYANVTQVYDAASSSYKGRAGSFTPKVGDIIVFHNNGSRTHTGLVYDVDSKYVYTIEGNASDMCGKHSYLLSNTSYIYGYVRPMYAASTGNETVTTTTEQYGEAIELTVNQLSKGMAGAQVKTVQRVLYSRGIKGADGKAITVDGDFGENTLYAVKLMQKELGLTQDGIVGTKTWTAMVTNYD